MESINGETDDTPPYTGRRAGNRSRNVTFTRTDSEVPGGVSIITDGARGSSLAAPPPSYEQSSNYPLSPGSSQLVPGSPPKEDGMEPVPPPPSYEAAVSMEVIRPGGERRASQVSVDLSDRPPMVSSTYFDIVLSL